MKRTLSWQKLVLGAFAVLLAFTLLQTITSCNQASAADVEKGQALYVSYCQVCHGEHGDGAMADRLSSPPPDLRQITARNNGEFPRQYIADMIAGKERILGHPESDMPSFWVAIRNGENLSSDEEVEQQIGYLIDYLKSIQEK